MLLLLVSGSICLIEVVDTEGKDPIVGDSGGVSIVVVGETGAASGDSEPPLHHSLECAWLHN